MIFSDGRRLELADLPARLRPAGLVPEPPRAGTLADALDTVVAQVEREMIIKRLAQFKGNRTAAADSLGISRKTLFNKMRQHGISVPGEEAEGAEP